MLVADFEHSALELRDLHEIARVGALHGAATLARIPPEALGQAGRILESGIDGIQLAGVEEPAQLDELARAVRFRPDGVRGCATSHRAAGFGRVRPAAYVAQQDVVLVAQVESAAAIAVLPRLLAARPAPDVWFIGPVDLSVDLGHPGELDHPVVREAVDAAAGAIAAAGARLGIFAGGEADAAAWRARGAALVLAGSDLTLLAQRADALVGGWRASDDHEEDSP